MKLNKILSLLIIFVICSSNIFAEGNAEAALENAASLMMIFTILIIALVLWLTMVYSEKNDNNGSIFFSPMKKFNQLITGAAPLEKEKEILLDHDYDGIRELDNKIPPWFHAMFWGTIIFAIIYMISYHIIGTGNVQTDEYVAEIQTAALERDILIRSGAFINEETVSLKMMQPHSQAAKKYMIKTAQHVTDLKVKVWWDRTLPIKIGYTAAV